jgi:hypothetical protein
MEPVTLLIAALTATGAFLAKSVVGNFFHRSPSGSPLEIVTADGKKVTIEASSLTREKVEEITKTGSAPHVRAAY